MIAPWKEKENFKAYENKLILTKINNIPMSFYLEGDTLIQTDIAQVDNEGKECGLLNNIYVGKIKNIAQNLNAAFVEYKQGSVGFLSLDKNKSPILLNRPYNGKLSSGDEILIQVEKEPVKTKDAVLTTNLTFSGTYAVLSTEHKKIGFSNKLSNKRKDFLKNSLVQIKQEVVDSGNEWDFGLILRTNSGTLTEETISLLKEEIINLIAKKEELLNKAKTRPPFTLLYQDKTFALKRVQDAYVSKIDRIITDDLEIYETLISTEYKEAVSLYTDEMLSLQALYGLSAKLEEALRKKVWLKSGGYLVIEPTEALTVIDVNSGKCVDKKKRQEMLFQVNIEAAIEAARQIRLRNLSGIILIDFINLEDKTKEDEFITLLRNKFRNDPVLTTLVDITPLGLVEITRKKVAAPLYEKCKGISDFL
ncbi:MAG: ribonuclease E/G [Lachnospiraceae bacterium]|nr:ribonuclease E/G [Lachnospiraceae bacterium]